MTPFLPEKTIFKYVISAMQLQEDGAGVGCQVSGKAGFRDQGLRPYGLFGGYGSKAGGLRFISLGGIYPADLVIVCRRIMRHFLGQGQI